MNELYEIFKNYSTNKKVLDKTAIQQIINILIREYQLDDYLKSYKAVDFIGDGYKKLYTVTSYDKENKELLVSSITLERTIRAALTDYLYNIPEEEKIFFKNTVIIQNILREIEHINQQKSIANDDLEGNLLRFSEETNKDNIQYNTPAERMAIIKSWKKTYEIVKDIDKYPNLVKYCNNELINAYKDGYIDDDNKYIEEGPTYRYIKQIEKPRIIELELPLKSLEEMQETFIGTDAKILYGLPMRYERFSRYIK